MLCFDHHPQKISFGIVSPWNERKTGRWTRKFGRARWRKRRGRVKNWMGTAGKTMWRPEEKERMSYNTRIIELLDFVVVVVCRFIINECLKKSILQ